MTNQSELEEVQTYVFKNYSLSVGESYNLAHYITANYTPNSEVMRLRLEHAAKLANLDQKIAWLEGKVEGLTKDKE